jgi:hypothetical protein
MKRLSVGLIVMLCGAISGNLGGVSSAQSAGYSGPETILATYRVKPSQMEAFLQLMPPYWAALRSTGLVVAEPHVLLRGADHGKPIVVEVFSWKDHDAPEHVPAAIQGYWDKFNGMVEDRDGHRGIEFPEMNLVQLQEK